MPPPDDRFGDRRAEVRVEIVGDVWSTLVVTRSWPLRDLSTGGILVECNEPLIVGTVHQVHLCLDDDSWDVTVMVRHLTRGVDQTKRYAVGLSFLNLSSETRDGIARFLACAGARSEGGVAS